MQAKETLPEVDDCEAVVFSSDAEPAVCEAVVAVTLFNTVAVVVVAVTPVKASAPVKLKTPSSSTDQPLTKLAEVGVTSTVEITSVVVLVTPVATVA